MTPRRPSSRFLRWLRRRPALARPAPVRSRRQFLIQGGVLTILGAGYLATRFRPSAWLVESDRVPVRPPTASLDDPAFRAACIGCGLCGTVCENGCIRYFGADEPRWGALTPYLDVRRRSCTLCMRCTQICPTSALTPTVKDLAALSGVIDMGVARVDTSRCISYLGRICGYCHDACPLPRKAIALRPPARPVVLEDGCVGCGRCVEMCPQYPTAIDIIKEGRA